MDTLRLEMLPTELLPIIFNYCDLYDLPRLDQVCKRFHNIIRSDAVWKRHVKNFLVTNHVSEQFRQRCNLLLPSYSKHFILQNWVQGGYQERIFQTPQDGIFLQLQLTSDKIWCNKETMIFGFDRQETTHQKFNTVSCDKTFLEVEENRKPIEKFILWRDYIVTGHSDGSIMWQAESPVKKKYNGCYECRIKKQLNIHTKKCWFPALDATSNVMCTASDSQYAIIRVENSLDIDSINNDNIVHKEIPEGKILEFAINPLGTILSALIVYEDLRGFLKFDICYIDLEQEKTFSNSKIIKRIITQDKMSDMLWEDPNTLLMCSSYGIHKYDFRSRVNDYVSTWRYPKDDWMLCISSDHHNTMITGSHNFKAVLWDQRMPNFVQIYSMPTQYNGNKDYDYKNPLYSLQFDSTKVYCATSRSLYDLDFSKRECPVRD